MYLDQKDATEQAINLLKKFRDGIGITFAPTERQKKSINSFWKKQDQQQTLIVMQSQITNEPVIFEIKEDDAFEWTEELKDKAYKRLIDRNILYTTFIYRAKIAESIIDKELVRDDERFIVLTPKTLLHTFYNDHNQILKKKFEKKLNEEQLTPSEKRILKYISEAGMELMITYANSEMSYVFILIVIYYIFVLIREACSGAVSNICSLILSKLLMQLKINVCVVSTVDRIS